MSSTALEEKMLLPIVILVIIWPLGCSYPGISLLHSVFFDYQTDKSVLYNIQKITNKSGETEKKIQNNLKAYSDSSIVLFPQFLKSKRGLRGY
jgi:hypothetical protein